MAARNLDNTGRGSDEEEETNNGFEQFTTPGRGDQPEAHQVQQPSFPQNPYQAAFDNLNQSNHPGAGGYNPPPTSAPPRFTGLNPEAGAIYPGGVQPAIGRIANPHNLGHQLATGRLSYQPSQFFGYSPPPSPFDVNPANTNMAPPNAGDPSRHGANRLYGSGGQRGPRLGQAGMGSTIAAGQQPSASGPRSRPTYPAGHPNETFTPQGGQAIEAGALQGGSPTIPNPNNPLAQGIPTNESGVPVRPQSSRLPTIPAALDPQTNDAGPSQVGSNIQRRAPGWNIRRREDQRWRAELQGAGLRSRAADDITGSINPGTTTTKHPLSEKSTDADGGEEKGNAKKKQKIEKKPKKKPKVPKTLGLTRTRDDNLQWFDPGEEEWHNAIYHESIREQLLTRDKAGPYKFPRERGKDRLDRTSLVPYQRNWGLERSTGWNAITDDILRRFERQGYQPPEQFRGVPGYMWFEDRIVIDWESQAIIDWDLIPSVLSSKFEGGYMIAFRRLCQGIRPRDFRARMPAGSPGVTGLTNREETFRNDNGLVPWTARGGTQALIDAVRARLDPADLILNTIGDFNGLTPAELNAAKAPNKKSKASQSKHEAHEKRRKEEAEAESKARRVKKEEQAESAQPSPQESNLGSGSSTDRQTESTGDCTESTGDGEDYEDDGDEGVEDEFDNDEDAEGELDDE